MGKLKTNEQFIKDLKLRNPSIISVEHYINNSTPILCKCKICGLIWRVRPGNLLNGYGCPTCGIKRRAKTQSKDPHSFVAELESINSNIELMEIYAGARTPIKCKCRICAHIWKAAPTNLLKGRGCPICAKKTGADKRRRTHDEFLEIVHSHHPNIEPLEEYTGIASHIKMKCNTCGYTWKTASSVLINGGGCPRCANNGIYSNEEFRNKLHSINPFVEVLSNYQRTDIPVTCKCLRCGNTWESRPNNLLQGKGCPACYHSSTSFVEQVIFEVLKLVIGSEKVLSRDRKAIGKELDIYVPTLRVAVEPGSWRWHNDKVENDRSKRDLCDNVGIKLITIYTDYNEQMPPFKNNCICIKETLGVENDIQILKTLIFNLLSLLKIEFDSSLFNWDMIIKTAYNNSRRITTDEFICKSSKINPLITVLGEYTGALNKIECKCKTCGHLWSPAANSVLQGHGCPKCADTTKGISKRKTHETFKKELYAISPTITLMSNYVVSTQKVKCQCSICGNEWEAQPGNLLKGKGCPACARKKRKNGK